MSHMISSITGSLVQQMMFGQRTNSASSKKPSTPFQTIDSDSEISISQKQLKQAIASMAAADAPPSSDDGTTIERIDVQQGTASAPDSGTLANSSNDANVATGPSGAQSTVAKISSLKSLESLANQPAPAGSGPGSVVNVLM